MFKDFIGKVWNKIDKRKFKQGALSKGKWLEITGNDFGGFHVNYLKNGKLVVKYKSMLYEEAQKFASVIQESLGLTDDRVVVCLSDLLNSVDKSATVDDAKKAALEIMEEINYLTEDENAGY